MKIKMPKVYTIFAHFMVREGWSFFDVQWEINFLKKQNINPDMSYKEMKEAYFPMVRKGAKKRLNRKDRVNVLLALQNAMNHASFPESA